MRLNRWLLEATRIILGLVFVASGWLKAIDPLGGAIKIEEYMSGMLGTSYWTWLIHLSTTLAVLLCILEFAVGAFLLMGIYRRITAWTSFAIMIVMSLLTGYIYVTDALSDCGCFGEVIKLTNGESLLKNLIFLPISYYLAKYARQMTHLYTRRERWVPALLAIIGIVQFTYSNLNYLPYKDFRPYKIGYNLIDRIQQADSIYQSELLAGTQYLYSKEGQQQAFSADNLPDSTWSYEGQLQDEALKNKPLPYAFEIQNKEGLSVQDLILGNPKGGFLLLSANWSEADQDHIDEINELSKFAQDHGYEFYGVSASTPEEESEWRYQTGADYPILFMDATTIKTIIRANPGIMLLKSGVIVDKISGAMIPSIEDIPAFVESRMERGETSLPSWKRIVLLGVWALLVGMGSIRLLLRHLYAYSYLAKVRSKAQ